MLVDDVYRIRNGVRHGVEFGRCWSWIVAYISFHNHESGERIPPRQVSFTLVHVSSVFDFHDYGRKGTLDGMAGFRGNRKNEVGT